MTKNYSSQHDDDCIIDENKVYEKPEVFLELIREVLKHHGKGAQLGEENENLIRDALNRRVPLNEIKINPSTTIQTH